MARIIERKIQSKHIDDSKCEDGMFFNDNFIAVVDGVTSKGEFLCNTKTSGVYAKDIIIEVIASLPFDISASDAINSLNNALFSAYESKKELKDNVIEYLRASVIIYSNYRKQIWSFGDCQCLINDTLFTNYKKVDLLISELRSFILSAEIIKGKSIEGLQIRDTGREYIMPLLKTQLNYENIIHEYGYDILNGQDINLDNISVYCVAEGDVIVLASDGYPFLKSTLADSENELERLLKEDPLCYKQYKTTKGLMRENLSFDDRAFIRFVV